MKFKKQKTYFVNFLAVLLIAVLAIIGCDSSGSGDTPDTTEPTLSSTYPADGATGVPVNTNITATFDEAMNPATIVAANFTLYDGLTPVLGTVVYDIGNKTAVMAPAVNMTVETEYTATVTTAVTDSSGNAILANQVWSFTTEAAGLGPAPVRLGTAGNFAILSKSGISTVPASAITGNIGVSPAAESYLTGFSQTKATGYSTAPQVTGYLYAADMTPPTPSNMTTAVSDMEAAYTDAAGRSTAPIALAADLGGLTLGPGLHVAALDVTMSDNLTLSGAANDVWIFQISGTLTIASAKSVILGGEAQARNIFWQVADEVVIGTGAHFEGNIIAMTDIVFETGSSMNGRALAQTAVTLDQTTIVKPAQ